MSLQQWMTNTTEINMEEDVLDDELWVDEDQVKLGDVPDTLWSDAPLDKLPAAPELWIDQLADEVEINRLLSTGVLQRQADSELQPVGTLTTRFVYDWRKKTHSSGLEKWMRRSRFLWLVSSPAKSELTPMHLLLLGVILQTSSH